MLLRDLLGTSAGREQKRGRIQEVLETEPTVVAKVANMTDQQQELVGAAAGT